VIEIVGQEELDGFTHRIIPDRIEAGTFLIAGAATGGDVEVSGARPELLEALLEKLTEAGVQVEAGSDRVRVRSNGPLRAFEVSTAPFPGFPTDLQAQLVALACRAEGRSRITETIFENRFMHVDELARLGADISIDGASAVVSGVAKLEGAEVMATDLRASVSLVIAGLMAENTTRLQRVYHLDRGYERLTEKLEGLGADVARVSGPMATFAHSTSIAAPPDALQAGGDEPGEPGTIPSEARNPS
jgi:UDP-N-acetylglucosamine 1-carboxyvinyltransferase